MKIFSTLVLVCFLGLGSFAQDVKSEVSAAFKAGNAKELAKHFTKSLDLVVNDNDDVYSKVQAEQIIKKFFAQHKPSSFVIKHEGESRNNVKYYVGELKTSNGDFRVTINMKKVDQTARIHQLRIE